MSMTAPDIGGGDVEHIDPVAHNTEFVICLCQRVALLSGIVLC
jgi:hypothetical protein